MKKIIFGLSLLMSIVGTTNSFGSTHNDKNHNQKTTHFNHVDKSWDKNCTCKNCIEINKRNHQDKQLAGGYTQQRNLTKQDKQLFNKTYKGKDKLTPVSVATQVVNGINYKFICKDKRGKKVTVIIYQSLPHMGSKSKVVSINR